MDYNGLRPVPSAPCNTDATRNWQFVRNSSACRMVTDCASLRGERPDPGFQPMRCRFRLRQPSRPPSKAALTHVSILATGISMRGVRPLAAACRSSRTLSKPAFRLSANDLPFDYGKRDARRATKLQCNGSVKLSCATFHSGRSETRVGRPRKKLTAVAAWGEGVDEIAGGAETGSRVGPAGLGLDGLPLLDDVIRQEPWRRAPLQGHKNLHAPFKVGRWASDKCDRASS